MSSYYYYLLKQIDKFYQQINLHSNSITRYVTKVKWASTSTVSFIICILLVDLLKKTPKKMHFIIFVFYDEFSLSDIIA